MRPFPAPASKTVRKPVWHPVLPANLHLERIVGPVAVDSFGGGSQVPVLPVTVRAHVNAQSSLNTAFWQ